MNRGQKRARWQSQFRQERGAETSLTNPPAASAPLTSKLTHAPSVPRGQPSAVQLRIEEFVLRGFGRGSERVLASSFKRELGRILTARGVPDVWMHDGCVEVATANKIQIRAGESAHSIGERVARALYGTPAGGKK